MNTLRNTLYRIALLYLVLMAILLVLAFLTGLSLNMTSIETEPVIESLLKGALFYTLSLALVVLLISKTPEAAISTTPTAGERTIPKIRNGPASLQALPVCLC